MAAALRPSVAVSSSWSWVDFIYSPETLQRHLALLAAKQTLAPTAADLIVAFLEQASGKRQKALTRLAAEVVARVRLTLESFELIVPKRFQYTVLCEVLAVTSGGDTGSYYAAAAARWVLRCAFNDGDNGVVAGETDTPTPTCLPTETEAVAQLQEMIAQPPALVTDTNSADAGTGATAADVGCLCACDLADYAMARGSFQQAYAALTATERFCDAASPAVAGRLRGLLSACDAVIRGGELSAVTSGEFAPSDSVDVTTSSETKLAAPSAVAAARSTLDAAAVAVSKYERVRASQCLDEADTVRLKRVKSAATADAARAVAAAVQADQAEEGISLLQRVAHGEFADSLSCSALTARGLALAMSGDWQNADAMFARAMTAGQSPTALYGSLQAKIAQGSGPVDVDSLRAFVGQTPVANLWQFRWLTARMLSKQRHGQVLFLASLVTNSPSDTPASPPPALRASAAILTTLADLIPASSDYEMALAMDAMDEGGGGPSDDLSSVAGRLSTLLAQLVSMVTESELSLTGLLEWIEICEDAACLQALSALFAGLLHSAADNKVIVPAVAPSATSTTPTVSSKSQTATTHHATIQAAAAAAEAPAKPAVVFGAGVFLKWQPDLDMYGPLAHAAAGRALRSSLSPSLELCARITTAVLLRLRHLHPADAQLLVGLADSYYAQGKHAAVVRSLLLAELVALGGIEPPSTGDSRARQLLVGRVQALLAQSLFALRAPLEAIAVMQGEFGGDFAVPFRVLRDNIADVNQQYLRFVYQPPLLELLVYLFHRDKRQYEHELSAVMNTIAAPALNVFNAPDERLSVLRELRSGLLLRLCEDYGVLRQ